MYAYIRGHLKESNPAYIIIEAAQVGYKLFIPAHAFHLLPPLEAEIKLYTSFVIREYSQTLFGFLQPHELALFESLLNVSGVGPKLALSIIGHMPPDQLISAITTQNIASLSRIPGIGKKTAERLIVEMKDKLTDMIAHTPHYTPTHESSLQNDLLSALLNLGYNHMTAQKAIKKAMKEEPEATDLAKLIPIALKNI